MSSAKYQRASLMINILIQVMAWCRQATSHYLNQCWPIYMSSPSTNRPQWINTILVLSYFADIDQSFGIECRTTTITGEILHCWQDCSSLHISKSHLTNCPVSQADVHARLNAGTLLLYACVCVYTRPFPIGSVRGFFLPGHQQL